MDPHQGPRREVPADVHGSSPRIERAFEQITDRCLTRSRANRYQTAAEAEGDLRVFLRKFMPNYSRSHLGRFIRKMFATEIERELRMLEEQDDRRRQRRRRRVTDARDENFEPPEVPFQPKPTSVSIIAARDSTHGSLSRDSQYDDFSGDSNFTTMPKTGSATTSISKNTLILENGRARNALPRRRLPAPAPARPAGLRRRPALGADDTIIDIG